MDGTTDVVEIARAESERGELVLRRRTTDLGADVLELTLVEGVFSGDTYFPPFRHLLADAGGPYGRTFREAHPAEAGRPAFRFETYTRAGGAD